MIPKTTASRFEITAWQPAVNSGPDAFLLQYLPTLRFLHLRSLPLPRVLRSQAVSWMATTITAALWITRNVWIGAVKAAILV